MTINRRNDETLLAANECAARIGLSVRALRLYEQRGLIRPPRTAKGWRLYGAAEIARLHEILALKLLGLSLSRITALLQGKAVDLDSTLALQHAALSQQRVRLERGLSLVGAARAALADGRPVSTDDLIKLAKEANMTETTTDEIAWRRYEQARPRSAIRVDSTLLKNYVGYYRYTAGPIFEVTAETGRLFVRGPGEDVAIEFLAESERTFFRKGTPAQVTFIPSADGPAAELVLHANGHERKAIRIEAEEAHKAAAALDDRIKSGSPNPDSEATLRHLISEYQAGRPCVDRMTPELAQAVREQFDASSAILVAKGSLRALQFRRVGLGGHDVYKATFDTGALTFRIAWSEDGRIVGLRYRF
ncbi:DNA-binding transcriptional regulator, MerR family [Bosea sp. OK403]|uniref:MerR family transcriptional regulator n=1 Tax=Bosea sp. OK403 TaxID=1855286 RepID=UPI0008EE91DC|nr:MerR family transcriptional regulator [Bosea sp. OK403]SFI29724.1 DNA-binding transcriptional regulator, MerR family [Bosea sp. OK403]